MFVKLKATINDALRRVSGWRRGRLDRPVSRSNRTPGVKPGIDLDRVDQLVDECM